MNREVILQAENLRVDFHNSQGRTQAVRGVDFHIYKGETLGIVGESGSGKSVMMKSILGILPETAKVSADALHFEGEELSSLSSREYRKLRGQGMTMIFQDPMTALNPLMRIGEQIREVIRRHQDCSARESRERAAAMLAKVGISAPEKRMRQYPHELSGGMRQRVLIAMALSCGARLLVADEPTTALDVTIQAQILDLLADLQREYDTSIALITHDMGVVASMCSRILIMYGGLIMERGTTEEIFYSPRHPYTKALLQAIPTLDLEKGERLRSIPGTPPSLRRPPEGCPFAERCDFVMKKCRESVPKQERHSDTHLSACFMNGREEEESL